MEAEIPGDIESEDEEGALGLEDLEEVETWYLCEITKFYLGEERTLKALSLGGRGWYVMRRYVTQMISECSICQKLKYQREPNQDDVDHELDLTSYLFICGYAGSVERGRIG